MGSQDPASPDHSKLSFPSDAEVDERVFITPRVVDQTAYRQYTDSLKGLIREAGGKGTQLRSDADQARQLGENLSKAAEKLKQRLETTAKLLPALDNRVRRAEAILDQTLDEAKLPEQIESRVSDAIQKMENRIEQALSQAEAKLDAMNERYEELHSGIKSGLDDLESVKERADRATREARQSLDAISAQVQTCAAKQEALDLRAEQTRQAIETQLAQAVQTMERYASEAMKRAQAVEMLSQRAIDLLGFDPACPGDDIAPDSLMMLVQRGAELEQAARAAATELGSLQQTSAHILSKLEAGVEDAENMLETMNTRQVALKTATEESLAELATAQLVSVDELAAVRDQITEIEQRREQVHEGMADLSGEIGSLEEEVTTRLEALRARAAQELSKLQLAVAAQRRSLEELAHADSIQPLSLKSPLKQEQNRTES